MTITNPNPKPVVYYRDDLLHIIHIGHPAVVVPLEHPSPLVTGDGLTPVRTSPVGWVDGLTGEFCTENTHYKPVSCLV